MTKQKVPNKIKISTAEELLMFDPFVGREVCVKIPQPDKGGYFGTLTHNGKDFIRLENVYYFHHVGGIDNVMFAYKELQHSLKHWQKLRDRLVVDSCLINKSSGIEYIVDMASIKDHNPHKK